jgi:heterogeneous nuclear ribonucleoprotein A1/A3
MQRKIYVARVDAEIDKERLYEFFSKYGEIEEGPIGFNKYTGKSRGYAMIVYKTEEGGRRALEEPMKNFEGHLLRCQPATLSRANSRSRQVDCSSNSGMGVGYGSDIEEPPGFQGQRGSWL